MKPDAFPTPAGLRGALDLLRGAGTWDLSTTAIGDIDTHLHRPAAVKCLSLERTFPTDADLSWVTLTEVASSKECLPLLASALSTLHVADQTCALVIGGDGRGDVGVSLGMSPHSVSQWQAQVAPDAIWEPVNAHAVPGLATALRSGRSELAFRGRVEPGDPSPDHAPPPLHGFLTAGTSLGPWSLVMVLHPMAEPLWADQERLLAEIRTRVPEGVSELQTYSQTRQVTRSDPRADRIARTLAGWQALIGDARRTGGWVTLTYAAADAPRDALAVAAQFGATLGPMTRRSRPDTVHVWDRGVTGSELPAPITWLSSLNLADILAPPETSMGKVLVREPIAGGRHVADCDRPVTLGSWLGTSIAASFDVGDLGAHAFVSGITGSGKSTSTRRLLSQLFNEYNIPFLVIDPAKSDYEELCVSVGTNLRIVNGADMRANVLAPWPGRPADRHVQAVSTAFRGAFGMPMPVPYVASILFEELAGRAAQGEPVTLHDAYARLDTLIAELHYAGEIETNIKASLGLRLRALLQPRRAERVAGIGAPTWLMDGPTIVQLSDLADEEERNFAAAMLVLWVADAARARGASHLSHVTVIEEAHRLMPETSPEKSPEQGDSATVASRLMSQLLAEVRAYGESVIVVDQSPAAVSREVIRNTNLKLAHRVVDPADQKTLGGALGLSEDDHDGLGSLGRGRCLLSTARLPHPQAVSVVPAPTLKDRAAVTGAPAGGSRPCCSNYPAIHHRAEAFGRHAELIVAGYLTGSARNAPWAAAAALAEQSPGLQAACILAVGTRRHAQTLVRLGTLAASDFSEWVETQTLAILTRAVPRIERTTKRPYPACAACQHACLTRSLVASGGLSVMGMAREGMQQRWTLPERRTVLTAAIESATVEARAFVSDRISMQVGFCAGVHLAHEYDLSEWLAQQAGDSNH